MSRMGRSREQSTMYIITIDKIGYFSVGTRGVNYSCALVEGSTRQTRFFLNLSQSDGADLRVAHFLVSPVSPS